MDAADWVSNLIHIDDTQTKTHLKWDASGTVISLELQACLQGATNIVIDVNRQQHEAMQCTTNLVRALLFVLTLVCFWLI